jgi:uncharacterized protein (TIGR02145 family)
MSVKRDLKKSASKILILLLTATITISCKKKPQLEEPVPTATINGSSYRTVKIGTQLWTAVNYNGPGGVNYNNATNDPAYGKLYTRVEAQSLSLPNGWRLPSKADFEKLINSFPHKQQNGYLQLQTDARVQLMATTSWRDKNGNNSSGFNATGAGIGYVDSGNENTSRFRGLETQFISSSSEDITSGEITRPMTWALIIHSEVTTDPHPFTDFYGAVSDVVNSDFYRYSIRLVKDVN